MLLTASTSKVEILELLQSKALRMIVDTPWFMPNAVIRRNLQTSAVKQEVCCCISQYSARLSDQVVDFMAQPDNNRWLWRHLPNDLPTRFLV
jgi:hypothetical protein